MKLYEYTRTTHTFQSRTYSEEEIIYLFKNKLDLIRNESLLMKEHLHCIGVYSTLLGKDEAILK
jgi:hypothetical protein